MGTEIAVVRRVGKGTRSRKYPCIGAYVLYICTLYYIYIYMYAAIFYWAAITSTGRKCVGTPCPLSCPRIHCRRSLHRTGRASRAHTRDGDCMPRNQNQARFFGGHPRSLDFSVSVPWVSERPRGRLLRSLRVCSQQGLHLPSTSTRARQHRERRQPRCRVKVKLAGGPFPAQY